MAIEELNSVLIEGFDSAKIQAEEGYDKDWKTVVSAKQNDKILQAEITGIEQLGGKDCAVVSVGHIRGYIPIEFTGVENLRQLRAMTGKPSVFKVLEYVEEEDKRIFMASRTDALKEMAAITLRRIKVNDEILAVVRNVSPTLVRADIGGIEVRIPLTEMKYGWIDDLTEHVKIGDHLKVKVTAIDEAEQKVTVSAKALQKDPWQTAKERYKRNGEYVGKVSGVRDFGIFVNLEDGVDSLASHLKFQNVKKGDKVLIRVNNIDEANKQIRCKIVRVN